MVVGDDVTVGSINKAGPLTPGDWDSLSGAILASLGNGFYMNHGRLDVFGQVDAHVVEGSKRH